MRPVNLLPERYRPAQASGRARGSAYVVLAGLAALLTCVLAVAVLQRQVDSRRAELARLQVETQAAQARATQLGDFGSFAALKEERLAAVRRLAGGRVDWERLMRELAHVLPDGVWLKDVQADGGAAPSAAEPAAAGGVSATAAPDGPTLSLEGCAPSQEAVAAALVRLRELDRARDVNLSRSARVEGEGSAPGDSGAASTGCERGYEWSAAVSLRPPSQAAAGEGRVPARLGGGS